MRYDELFHDAASVGEPVVPPDVVGQLARARTRRRQRLALVSAPLAVLAAIAAVVLSPIGSSHEAPSGIAAATRLPRYYLGLLDGDAVRVEVATGRRTVLGRVHAVTSDGDGWFTADEVRPCQDQIQLGYFHRAPHFPPVEAHGRVTDLALSPDGTRLAYSVLRVVPGVAALSEDQPCGQPYLVVRNRTGSGKELVVALAPGTDGGAESLAWSPDSTQLVFQTAQCCDDAETLQVVAPVSSNRARLLDTAPPRESCRLRWPAWAGDTLLVVEQCVPSTGAEVDRVREAVSGKVVATLPDGQNAVGLDADPHRHLLVTLYGVDHPGDLLAYDGRRFSKVGTGVAGAHWNLPDPTPSPATSP